jgi:hypothetical protein
VDAVIRSLRRLASLGPDPDRAYRALMRLRPPRIEEEFEPVERRPLSPELEQLLEAPLPTARNEHAVVFRVLRDL